MSGTCSNALVNISVLYSEQGNQRYCSDSCGTAAQQEFKTHYPCGHEAARISLYRNPSIGPSKLLPQTHDLTAARVHTDGVP